MFIKWLDLINCIGTISFSCNFYVLNYKTFKLLDPLNIHIFYVQKGMGRQHNNIEGKKINRR